MSKSIKFNDNTFLDASGIRIDGDILSTNRVTLTYVGWGVDSGMNEHPPYFDFLEKECESGLYLVCNSNANVNTNIFTCTIATYNKNQPGVYFLKGIGLDTGVSIDTFSLKDSHTIQGNSWSWGANLLVYKINICVS